MCNIWKRFPAINEEEEHSFPNVPFRTDSLNAAIPSCFSDKLYSLFIIRTEKVYIYSYRCDWGSGRGH